MERRPLRPGTRRKGSPVAPAWPSGTPAVTTSSVLPPPSSAKPSRPAQSAPDISGYEVASRYIPAEGRVAGDWFDVARLPSGQFVVGIGDVGGHGINAASLMAQLRNAARGLAIGGAGPEDIIRGLAELTLMDDAHGFATALYGSLDPDEGSFFWSSAGHIPPLIFGSGFASWLSYAQHPPLGVQMVSKPRLNRHQRHAGRGARPHY